MAEASPTPRLKVLMNKCKVDQYSDVFVEYGHCSTDDFYFTERSDQNQIINDLNIDKRDAPKVRKMWNMIWSTKRNEEKPKKVKREIIDISSSPNPPKQEEFAQTVNSMNNDKYYKQTMSNFGQDLDYAIGAEVQFFIPDLMKNQDYVNRFGVIQAKHPDDYYDILDTERDKTYFGVNWYSICRAQPLISHSASNHDNVDCIHNSNESTNLSIGISPVPSMYAR